MSRPARDPRALGFDSRVDENDASALPLSERNVARLFERQVQRTPHAPAVAFEKERLSYCELDARSNRLARALRGLGVGPGVPVGICMERSLETPLGVLAVLKAGGAYVALDPEYPRERLEFMLEDTRAPIVLTDERAERRVPRHDGQTIVLGSKSARAMLAAREETPLFGGARPEDLAYVIYTSGSTGRSKGVAMPHRALLNLVAWQIETSRNPAAKTLQFASLSFDVSFQEMFSTWCAGGELLLLSEETRRDSAALWGLLRSESIERLFLPFVALAHLAEAADAGGSDAPELREVITAGEQLQITPPVARLFAHDSSRTLQNQYGPSESHVVTAFTLRGSPENWPVLPPIGRPIANSRIYLLDSNRRPVPAGAAGEIYIGGVSLAHGYWNRPDLTAEKFVPDPFGSSPDGRLYRSGDLGRCRSDGEIEFLGRIDDQVKIRGYRVEPGEVAAALGRHKDVRDAVVVAREDAAGAKSLAAYVVARGSRPASGTDLRTFLKASLPEYMVPTAFVFLEAFPMTPSGKVDRRALPAPDSKRSSGGTEFVAPRDSWELRLAAIWERIFETRPIGVADDFFDLGGHSLLAARLFEEIQKAFGSRLLASSLLQAPTIEKLAARLRGGRKPARWTSLVPITSGRRPPLFCMHAGAGTILFYYDLARELGPDQPVYALQAQGLYGRHPPHKRIEEMAAHYLHEIRTVQPSGPYSLAGFCFGAILAFEMAQQLRQQGEEVALLASFDGGRPRYETSLAGHEGKAREPDQSALRSLASRISRHWRNFCRRGPAYLVEKVRGRAIDRAMTLEYNLGRRLADRGRPLPAFLRQRFFMRNNWHAEEDYRPRPYDGRMVVFSTAASEPALGWKELVRGGVEVHPIAGDHRLHRDLMKGQFVKEVATRLRESLA